MLKSCQICEPESLLYTSWASNLCQWIAVTVPPLERYGRRIRDHAARQGTRGRSDTQPHWFCAPLDVCLVKEPAFRGSRARRGALLCLTPWGMQDRRTDDMCAGRFALQATSSKVVWAANSCCVRPRGKGQGARCISGAAARAKHLLLDLCLRTRPAWRGCSGRKLRRAVRKP